MKNFQTRGLGIRSIWEDDQGRRREVTNRTDTHVQWANLNSARCERHWQLIERWLAWVATAKNVSSQAFIRSQCTWRPKLRRHQ